VAFNSDLSFIEEQLRKAADDDFAERHAEHRQPGAGGERLHPQQRALPLLHQAPDRAQFPHGAHR